jgi:FAD/FMN-containing dehydrogenase
MIDSHVLEKFSALLGTHGVLTADVDKTPFLHEWRGRVNAQSPAVLLPKNTAEVSDIVKLCAAYKIALVPQGGNTGLVGASVPTADNSMLCISLKRMNSIRSIDADDFSMVAEAGCILQTVFEIAAAQNRLFAMTLASEGSATIGGLAATNAGGSFTLRYGNMREQILGLEAVLPDGSIWNGLRSLRKNNSGYDLKQLLIGSEGTLGIITAATLKLLPKPTRIETALIALKNPHDAIHALGLLRGASEDTLAAFELMPRIAIESAVKYVGQREPFATPYPWLALVETHNTSHYGKKNLADMLEPLLDKKIIIDATIASSITQSRNFWNMREAIVEAQKHLGASLKHDVSVPISKIAECIEKGSALAAQHINGAQPYTFGHVGDGNIHFNISQPNGMDKETFIAQRDSMARLIHDLVISLGGSISAEHGIGRFKKAEFLRTADDAELQTMKKIKSAIDPQNIMNTGVLF